MSLLFQPLDELLSSGPKVRVLRVLLGAGGPLSGREVARRSRIALLSAQKALSTLAAMEVVERKEASAQHLYSINEASYLVRECIAPLFAAEVRRVDALFGRIRGILLEGDEDAGREILSATLFGSAARGEDIIGSDFDLLVLTRSDEAVWRIHSKLASAASALRLEFSIQLSPLVLPLSELRRQHQDGSAFARTLLTNSRTIQGDAPESLLNGYRGTAEED